MKEQIEKMARITCHMYCPQYEEKCAGVGKCDYKCSHYQRCKALYNTVFRKQSEGEWKRIEIKGANYGQVYYQHKDCEVIETQLFPSPYSFCPNCGAHMKGGAE